LEFVINITKRCAENSTLISILNLLFAVQVENVPSLSIKEEKERFVDRPVVVSCCDNTFGIKTTRQIYFQLGLKFYFHLMLHPVRSIVTYRH
jgi:hypothetical protein